MHKIPDIEPFKQKLSSLDEQMAAADFFSDAKKSAEVSREHQRLSSLIEKFEQYHKVEKQIGDNEELLGDSTKARNELGWKPIHSFDDLIKEMVDQDCK